MPQFDRSDFTLTRLLLAAVAVVTPVFLLVVPVVRLATGRALLWSGDTGAAHAGLAPLVRAAPGARLTWDGQASVRLADASTGLWLVTLLPGAVLAVAVVVVALLLRQVVGEIQVGRPFTPGSLRALRVVGLTVAVASVVQPLASGVATALVMDRAVAGRAPSILLTFSPLWLLAGLLVLALAEAFRVGSRLIADVEGLV